MTPKPKRPTPLTDPNEPKLEVVAEDETGYSVEDAYRILMGEPLAPVDVPLEE
jgi:hypothetical protein